MVVKAIAAVWTDLHTATRYREGIFFNGYRAPMEYFNLAEVAPQRGY
jgi:hypothetical protein